MALTRTPAWHALEEADERAWLDQWARLHCTPTQPSEPIPAAPMPALATTGSHR